MKDKVLIADVDKNLSEVLKGILRRMDCGVRVCEEAGELSRLLEEENWTLLICDVSMLPDVCLVPVAVTANYAGIVAADEAVRKGLAFVRLLKPVRESDVLSALKTAQEMEHASRPAPVQETIQGINEGQLHFGCLLGESPSMQELYRQIGRMAASGMNVLIRGESGTGKELAAKAIHNAGLGEQRPFLAINCASLSDQLLESELFGHVRGAFTGAVRSKEGLFQTASGGTLFLDEIGAISPSMQQTLLRVLEERKIRPVGGNEFIPVNARIITATNENLEKAIEEGRFRLDLFHRLNVLPLTMTPLRERREDIVPLAKFLLSKFGYSNVGLSEEAMAMLQNAPWPGNVRELENVLLRAAALLPEDRVEIMPSDLPAEMMKNTRAESTSAPQEPEMPAVGEQITLKAYLKECERLYLRRTLEHFNGDKEAASRALGISLASFYRKFNE